MDTLSAAEAAGILHVNVKRVQALARAGKLPATRVGRKWLFVRSELERLLSPGRAQVVAPVEISARNQLRGRVTELNVDGVMAEVRVQVGDQELVSVITRASVERMRLAVGDQVFAVIKSTEIMIGKG